jgi:hypothetical protein
VVATRIVLAEMPAVLEAIVAETIAREPDMVLVAQHVPTATLTTAVHVQQADVVIIRSDATADALQEALLDSRPRVRVLAISSEGRDVLVTELAPRRRRLRDVSPSSLIAAIRRAASDRDA